MSYRRAGCRPYGAREDRCAATQPFRAGLIDVAPARLVNTRRGSPDVHTSFRRANCATAGDRGRYLQFFSCLVLISDFCLACAPVLHLFSDSDRVRSPADRVCTVQNGVLGDRVCIQLKRT